MKTLSLAILILFTSLTSNPAFAEIVEYKGKSSVQLQYRGFGYEQSGDCRTDAGIFGVVVLSVITAGIFTVSCLSGDIYKFTQENLEFTVKAQENSSDRIDFTLTGEKRKGCAKMNLPLVAKGDGSGLNYDLFLPRSTQSSGRMIKDSQKFILEFFDDMKVETQGSGSTSCLWEIGKYSQIEMKMKN